HHRLPVVTPELSAAQPSSQQHFDSQQSALRLPAVNLRLLAVSLGFLAAPFGSQQPYSVFSSHIQALSSLNFIRHLPVGPSSFRSSEHRNCIGASRLRLSLRFASLFPTQLLGLRVSQQQSVASQVQHQSVAHSHGLVQVFIHFLNPLTPIQHPSSATFGCARVHGITIAYSLDTSQTHRSQHPHVRRPLLYAPPIQPPSAATTGAEDSSDISPHLGRHPMPFTPPSPVVESIHTSTTRVTTHTVTSFHTLVLPPLSRATGIKRRGREPSLRFVRLSLPPSQHHILAHRCIPADADWRRQQYPSTSA
ncbi:hypothetical protein CF326_g8981, partial [Tilletia indica]